jgi:hypothetical protein
MAEGASWAVRREGGGKAQTGEYSLNEQKWTIWQEKGDVRRKYGSGKGLEQGRANDSS